MMMAASNATHIFTSRAGSLYTQATSQSFPGSLPQSGSGVPSQPQSQQQMPPPQSTAGVPPTPQSQQQPSPLPNVNPGSISSSGAAQLSAAVAGGQSWTPYYIQCIVCDKVWPFYDDQSKADAKKDRSTHMSMVHHDRKAWITSMQPRTIQTTEDDNVFSLCEARWFQYPASADALCKQLPQKIQPECLNFDLHLVGLHLASHKPLQLLHDRTDRSLTLKMFTKERLMSHEKNKRKKIDFGSSNVVIDEDAYEDVKSNFEALQACLNYAILSSYVDVCDKSPLALMMIALEMYQERNLTPANAEKLFGIFINLKATAAKNGDVYPSFHEIRNSAQFQMPQTKSLAASEAKKTGSSNIKKQKTTHQAKYCHDYNNSTCRRAKAPDAATCILKGQVYVHACNQKKLGVYCGGRHTRNDCPNKE